MREAVTCSTGWLPTWRRNTLLLLSLMARIIWTIAACIPLTLALSWSALTQARAAAPVSQLQSASTALSWTLVEPWLGPDVSRPDGWVVGRLSPGGPVGVITLNARQVRLLSPGEGVAGEWTLPTGASALAVGDLDVDGFPELVVGTDGAGAVHVYSLRGGNPTRIGEGVYLWAPVRQLATGDVDGDGWPDLVARNERGQAFVFLQQEATLVEGWRSPSDGKVVRWVAVDDLDGDGRAELVLWEGANGLRTLRWENAHLVPIWDNYPWGNVLAVELADLDGDGRDDLLAVTDRGMIYAFGWQGAGMVTKYQLAVPELAKEWVGVADIDGDGRVELLGRSDRRLAIWRLGSSTAQAVAQVSLDWHPTRAVAGGRPGVIIAFAADGTIHALQRAETAVRVSVAGEARNLTRPAVIEGTALWLAAHDWAVLLGARTVSGSGGRSFYALRGFRILSLSVGERRARVNGREVPLDHPLRIYNEGSYVPITIAPLLGGRMTWDLAQRTLSVDP